MKATNVYVLAAILPLVYSVLSRAQDFNEHCRQKAVQKDLYRKLHSAITDNVAVFTDGRKHFALLDSGMPLRYEDFNPGKPDKFSKPGVLPMFVVENAMHLVEKIFPTGPKIASVSTQTERDFHFDSLSSIYDFILIHTMVTPRNFSDQEILRAKYYLQELVPNSELVVQNQTKLPRFLLYNYYRELYMSEKEKKDEAVYSNRTVLPQKSFENWSQKKLPALKSNLEAVFNKWQILGYKTEVERQLQYFDIDTHEDSLISARALFKSMAKRSERDAHTTVYPFTFKPDDWYKHLKPSLPESSDELRYRKSLLLAQQALMNATKNDLNEKTSEDVNNTLNTIESTLAELRKMVKNGVDKLLHMEVDCFTRVNLTVCGEIIEGHTAFRYLLQEIAEHFAQAEYLESILNSKSVSIEVLQRKLTDIAGQLSMLEIKISDARKKEIGDSFESRTSGSGSKDSSCKDGGQIHFIFKSKEAIVDSVACSEFDRQNNSLAYCGDASLPINATKKRLWNLQSCSIDNELSSFGLFSNFTRLMNNAESKVTASLHEVTINRPWLDLTMFEDSNHFTMKRGRGVVSPGPLEPVNYFHQVAESGRYLLPQYTSSLIVASDIKVFFPGLGVRNDSDTDNQTNGAINILMKYAYAATVNGGYGPFKFASAAEGTHNFQVQRKNGGLMISLHGAQLIGYITTVVPKFPQHQSDPPPPIACKHKPAESHRRKKRSLTDEVEHDEQTEPIDMKELARSLFSEGLSKLDTAKAPSKYMDILIRETESTKNRVLEFIEGMDNDRNHNIDSDEGSPTQLPSV